MTGKPFYRYVVECDGCGLDSEHYPSSHDALVDLYPKGWRKKERLNPVTNTPSKRYLDDACPGCAPTWETRVQPASTRYLP